MLKALYLALAHTRIVQHLIDAGKSAHDAHNEASAVTAGGIGSVVQWILANAPELYAFAVAIAALFGITLPPLPPIPTPAA